MGFVEQVKEFFKPNEPPKDVIDETKVCQFVLSESISGVVMVKCNTHPKEDGLHGFCSTNLNGRFSKILNGDDK